MPPIIAHAYGAKSSQSTSEVCARCSRVIQAPEKCKGIDFPVLETPEQLGSSPCRLCQALAKAVKRGTLERPALRVEEPHDGVLSWRLVLHDLRCTFPVYSWTMMHEANASGQETCRFPPNKAPYDKIKRWIHESKAFDQFGLVAGGPPIQLKVIDCSTKPPIIVAAPIKCRYVALSYVWGTVVRTFSYHIGDALQEDIPKTILDSIEVARELEIRYLWIDRYCIDQDDQHDVHCQVSVMAAIYANAYLTIFAVAGVDPSHGLPGVSTTQRLPPDDVMIGTVRLRPDRDLDTAEDIRISKWSSRAWTLQEGLFSRRRLFFTENEVVFSSNVEVFGEYSPRRFTRHLDCATFGPYYVGDVLTHDLGMLVSMYSERHLGRDEDALNAISGMLNALGKPGSKQAHMWGIPFNRPGVDNRILTLTWWSTRQGVRRYGFPSWSPLGWKSPVWFSGCVSDSGDASVEAWTGLAWRKWNEMKEEEIEALQTSPPVDSQFLRVITLTFHLQLAQHVSAHVETGRQLYCTGLGDYLLKPQWDVNPRAFHTNDQILCAVFSTGISEILLLKPLSNLESRKLPADLQSTAIYERVGCVDTYEHVYRASGPDGEVKKIDRNLTRGVRHRIESKRSNQMYSHIHGKSRHDLTGQVTCFLLG
ncbi:hypothetical protein OPT61_g4809 [Boeremia exigua]|uniref:Uncharacterized protein n=1 Tax=Boeremia exigua TaxID=749465 RepID=A0ACC2ICQ8_9PLEO|nr:hypothetical protein OPT61_g4809 [Boeremia exigua]